MPSAEKRTISLPTEQSAYIDDLVASGAYASASEVVRAGLRALQERDAAVEKWLIKEVVDVYDATQENPGRAISSDDIFAAIRARHIERIETVAGIRRGLDDVKHGRVRPVAEAFEDLRKKYNIASG